MSFPSPHQPSMPQSTPQSQSCVIRRLTSTLDHSQLNPWLHLFPTIHRLHWLPLAFPASTSIIGPNRRPPTSNGFHRPNRRPSPLQDPPLSPASTASTGGLHLLLLRLPPLVSPPARKLDLSFFPKLDLSIPPDPSTMASEQSILALLLAYHPTF